jgi:hypothetical protein
MLLESAPVKGGARNSAVTVKTLKRALKKAGLKTTGKKATLTRRAKKAHLMRGGAKLEFNVEIALHEVDDEGRMAHSPKPAEFVRKHHKEIISRIAGKRHAEGSRGAIGLTHAKGDKFTVTMQYNDDPKKATDRHPAKSAADAKRMALEYIDISDNITIDEKTYSVVVNPTG